MVCLFTKCGFDLCDDVGAASSRQLKLSKNVELNKQEFYSLRQEIRALIVDEFSASPEVKQIPATVEVVEGATASSSSSSSYSKSSSSRPQASFDPYSSFRHSTQKLPQSDGKSKTEAELSALNNEKRKILGGRTPEGKILSLSVITQEQYQRQQEQLRRAQLESSETSGDSNLLSQSLKRSLEAQAARENQGFTTKAMRDVAAMKRLKVYKSSKLMLVMEDKLIILVEFENGVSGTGGKVGKVLLDVTERLMKPGVGKYGLYVTPPRQDIDLNKTFKEQQMVPTGKAFFYFKNFKSSGFGSYLKDSVVIGASEGDDVHSVPQGKSLQGARPAESASSSSSEKKPKGAAEKGATKKVMSEDDMIKRMMGKKFLK